MNNWYIKISIFAISATKEIKEIPKEEVPINETKPFVPEVPAITSIEGTNLTQENGGFFVLITGNVVGWAKSIGGFWQIIGVLMIVLVVIAIYLLVFSRKKYPT